MLNSTAKAERQAAEEQAAMAAEARKKVRDMFRPNGLSVEEAEAEAAAALARKKKSISSKFGELPVVTRSYTELHKVTRS